jgi:DNA-binding GntR family transcriptional regulator
MNFDSATPLSQKGMAPEARSLAEIAYDTLIDQILNLTLKPGQMLNERSLSIEMNISRTPIREALTRLESEGLVTRYNGRLIMIRNFSVQEVVCIFYVRNLLESDGAQLAAKRISDETLDKLHKLFSDQMQMPVPDLGNHWDADDLLHDSIAEASGNTVLAEMVKNLRRKTRIFSIKRMPSRFIPGSNEHLQIIEALQRRDGEAAAAAMTQHLENSKQSVLNVLSSF